MSDSRTEETRAVWYLCPACGYEFDVAAEKPPCPKCGERLDYTDRIRKEPQKRATSCYRWTVGCLMNGDHHIVCKS